MAVRAIILATMVLVAGGCTAPVPEAVIVEEEKELIESVEARESEATDMMTKLLSAPLNLETFGEALTAEGLDFVAQFRLASVVGALVGQGYQIGEVAVELYEYDPESNYLKEAAESNTIESKNGELVPVAINGRYLLILNDHEEAEKILEVFNSFKKEE